MQNENPENQMAQPRSPENGDSKQPAGKSVLAIVIRALIVVFLVVALRGFVIAHQLGGVYRWQSLLFDAAWGSGIFAVLQLADHWISAGLKRLFGDKTRPRRFAAGAIRLGIVIMVFGTFFLATIQMHPPKIGCLKNPADFGIGYSEHRIQSSDGIEISLWSMPAEDRTRPVVLVTHGLGANKQNFLFVSRVFHNLNYNIVTFDFRGHGDSGGHTCSLGVTEAADVKAAFDFAEERFPDSPIYGWSTSMGSAAAVRAAAEYGIFDKLVVDATFASVKETAMETKFCYLGPLGGTAWQIARLWYGIYVGRDIEQYGPAKDMESIRSPVFLIHGTRDPIIPHTESDKLLAAAPEGTQLWKVDGAGHSGSIHHPDYSMRIVEFYEGGLAQSEPAVPAALETVIRAR